MPIPASPPDSHAAIPATAGSGEARQPYAPPKLKVFGDLAHLTANVGKKGKKDGGASAGSKKTGF
jgi:hypothetical protein